MDEDAMIIEAFLLSFYSSFVTRSKLLSVSNALNIY